MTEASSHDEPPALEEPRDLTAADVPAVLQATVAGIKDDDVPSLAAGVAFKIFLSLFPAAIAAVAVFSYVTTPADLDAVSDAIADVLPRRASEVVLTPVNDLVAGGGAGVGGLAIGAILAGLWAASSAAVTLMKALSRAYDVTESRTFVRQRVVAVAITLALFVTLLGLILLLVAGGPIQEALASGLGPVAGALLTTARLLGALLLLMLLFAVVYWIGPDRARPEWEWLSPGAIVGVVGWLVVSGAFTLYVRVAGDYEATYGALGGVIVLLLWLQLSMMMLLVGAELNRVIERVGESRAVLAEGSGFADAAPLAQSASEVGDPDQELVLPAVPPPAPGDPLPGLEEQGELAGTNGRGARTRVGAAAGAAAAGVLAMALRRRRRSKET